jgi:hypothetical protein
MNEDIKISIQIPILQYNILDYSEKKDKKDKKDKKKLRKMKGYNAKIKSKKIKPFKR